jgi:hypothetical protein
MKTVKFAFLQVHEIHLPLRVPYEEHVLAERVAGRHRRQPSGGQAVWVRQLPAPLPADDERTGRGRRCCNGQVPAPVFRDADAADVDGLLAAADVASAATSAVGRTT